MPSIQGSHTVQILPRAREVSIQDNWESDKYIVLDNGAISPSALTLSVTHSGFGAPSYTWKIYDSTNDTWIEIGKKTKTISVAPQENWEKMGSR